MRRCLPVFLMLASGIQAGEPETVSPARKQELVILLHQDCGSCHGMTLKGGLGPPLLPDSLAGKPDALLVATILEGRQGTAMPPWKALLTASEVNWLVGLLRRPP